jgi:hypothetical protein
MCFRIARKQKGVADAMIEAKASIAKITGVDRSTLYHFVRSRGLMPK